MPKAGVHCISCYCVSCHGWVGAGSWELGGSAPKRLPDCQTVRRLDPSLLVCCWLVVAYIALEQVAQTTQTLEPLSFLGTVASSSVGGRRRDSRSIRGSSLGQECGVIVPWMPVGAQVPVPLSSLLPLGGRCTTSTPYNWRPPPLSPLDGITLPLDPGSSPHLTPSFINQSPSLSERCHHGSFVWPQTASSVTRDLDSEPTSDPRRWASRGCLQSLLIIPHLAFQRVRPRTASAGLDGAGNPGSIPASHGSLTPDGQMQGPLSTHTDTAVRCEELTWSAFGFGRNVFMCQTFLAATRSRHRLGTRECSVHDSRIFVGVGGLVHAQPRLTICNKWNAR
jgi:hypothetical protein